MKSSIVNAFDRGKGLKSSRTTCLRSEDGEGEDLSSNVHLGGILNDVPEFRECIVVGSVCGGIGCVFIGAFKPDEAAGALIASFERRRNSRASRTDSDILLGRRSAGKASGRIPLKGIF